MTAAAGTGAYPTVRSVGALLPADLLARVVAGTDLPGLASDHYHLAGEPLRQAASRAFEYLRGVYARFRDELATRPGGDLGTGLTRERWLQPLLGALYYGRVPATPGGHLRVDGRDYPVSHLWADVPVHLLGWGVDLDLRTGRTAGAARAPQSMVQELLNRSPDHLWAVLSNGCTLRLLRDSAALVGQSYVEFDLETIFDRDLFSDFVLLFLLCHQSRLERLPGSDGQPGGVEDRWLERWRANAKDTGTRALTALRGQVTAALEVLGTGFLAHPANAGLRDRLAADELTVADYNRALLRVIYRLLFWFVAEDRGALLDPAADPVAVDRYQRYFSADRLRRTARRRLGTRHVDTWARVRLVLDGLGREDGRPELGLPGLGGLFESGPLDVVDGAALTNETVFTVVRLLSTHTIRGSAVLRTVDFQHLGAEELGSIYESLLELHPRYDATARTYTLAAAAGNERKSSGSYYTPSSLIDCLLDTALDPLLNDAMKAADGPAAEAALLAITVCDPAMGSGAFLVAAARRIARRLAEVRAGDPEPPPPVVQAALRDVVARCIHGVDINPMAVELAKVSLWLEGLEPGRPLAFLDANLRPGNALLGTTPALLAAGVPEAALKPLAGDDRKVAALLARRNRSERIGADDLFTDAAIPVGNADLAATTSAIRGTPAGSLADVHIARRRYRELVDSPARQHAQLVADAWCTAFVQEKSAETVASAVTDAVLRRLAADPAVRRMGRRSWYERPRCATGSSTGTWSFRTSSRCPPPGRPAPTPAGRAASLAWWAIRRGMQCRCRRRSISPSAILISLLLRMPRPARS